MWIITHDAYKNKKHTILFLIFSTYLQMGLGQQNQYGYVKFESYYRVLCFTYAASQKASALDSLCLKFTHERFHMWFCFFFPPPPSYPEQNQNKHHFYIHIFVQTSPFYQSPSKTDFVSWTTAQKTHTHLDYLCNRRQNNFMDSGSPVTETSFQSMGRRATANNTDSNSTHMYDVIKNKAKLTISWSSASVRSYSLMATIKMMAVTPSKQWIHFFLSDRWPPTSNILKAYMPDTFEDEDAENQHTVNQCTKWHRISVIIKWHLSTSWTCPPWSLWIFKCCYRILHFLQRFLHRY